jgi:hypothetical protein
VAAALLFAIIGGGVALAQQPEKSAGEPREAQAIEALSIVGKYLRTLKSFPLRADTTTDELLDNDQKVQFGGTIEYKVQQPNRLRRAKRFCLEQ